jgi:hypothetical protein
VAEVCRIVELARHGMWRQLQGFVQPRVRARKKPGNVVVALGAVFSGCSVDLAEQGRRKRSGGGVLPTG